EWFSPDNTPGIAIPFYLAHPRLMRLERKMIIEVEGGTQSECMRILRHEAGHVVQHAYQLHRRRRWRELFGRSSTRYPNYYRPDPASRLHPDLMPPDSLEGRTEQEIHKWKTEYDVVSTLRQAGHDVRPLGVQNELKPIRD